MNATFKKEMLEQIFKHDPEDALKGISYCFRMRTFMDKIKNIDFMELDKVDLTRLLNEIINIVKG